MLSCADADRFQIGMREAFGIAQGLVARVGLNDILMSTPVRDQHESRALEAFRRAKFKFAGRQFIFTSPKWGFTESDRAEYEKLRDGNLLLNDGANVKLLTPNSSLKRYIDHPI